MFSNPLTRSVPECPSVKLVVEWGASLAISHSNSARTGPTVRVSRRSITNLWLGLFSQPLIEPRRPRKSGDFSPERADTVDERAFGERLAKSLQSRFSNRTFETPLDTAHIETEKGSIKKSTLIEEEVQPRMRRSVVTQHRTTHV